MTAFKFRSLAPDDADRVYRSYPGLRDSVCPTCQGTHRYRWLGIERECDCWEQISLAKFYAAAGIGMLFQRLNWADYAGDTSVIPGVRNYLENHQTYLDRGMGLLIHGGVGTGKSMLSHLVLKDLVRHDVDCYATTFAGTIEAFTSTWGNREQKAWFAEKFMYSKVLLLDDLGKEMRSNNNLAQSTFDNILRTRVHEGRPTILNTNLTPRELGHGYGGAVLSLLKGASMRVEITGEDYRPSAAERTVKEIDAGETRPIS